MKNGDAMVYSLAKKDLAIILRDKILELGKLFNFEIWSLLRLNWFPIISESVELIIWFFYNFRADVY